MYRRLSIGTRTHPQVMGVSVAEITRQDDSAGPAVATVAAGTARAGKRGMHPRAGGASPMTSSTWVQFGGLSQTVGTAFAMEFFGARGHNIDTSIARLLDESGSALVLRPAKGTVRPRKYRTRTYAHKSTKPTLLLFPRKPRYASSNGHRPRRAARLEPQRFRLTLAPHNGPTSTR